MGGDFFERNAGNNGSDEGSCASGVGLEMLDTTAAYYEMEYGFRGLAYDIIRKRRKKRWPFFFEDGGKGW
jgi:hypothetical protein